MTPARSIDDPGFLEARDSRGMADLVAAFPAQFRETYDESPLRPLRDADRPSRVWIAAMGGSAFAGEMLAQGLTDARVGVSIVRGYELPRDAKSGDWLLAQSYSGNTEEVLALFERAADHGLRRVAIASGGRLETLAGEAGVPFLKLKPGYPPRASAGFGYTAGACLARCLAPATPDPALVEPSRLADRLEAGRKLWGPAVSAAENEAKTIALALHGRMPVVYAAFGAPQAVLIRWSAQFNENAKTLCHATALPEQNHNEIVAFSERFAPVDRCAVIFLRTGDEAEPVARRFRATREWLAARGFDCLEATASGATPMERLWWLCYLGDYVSLYLAALAGVDPTPVTAIDELKSELSKEKS